MLDPFVPVVVVDALGIFSFFESNCRPITRFGLCSGGAFHRVHLPLPESTMWFRRRRKPKCVQGGWTGTGSTSLPVRQVCDQQPPLNPNATLGVDDMEILIPRFPCVVFQSIKNAKGSNGARRSTIGWIFVSPTVALGRRCPVPESSDKG